MSMKVIYQTFLIFVLVMTETLGLAIFSNMPKLIRGIYACIYLISYFVLWAGIIASFVYLSSL